MAGRRKLQLRVVRGADVPAQARPFAIVRAVVGIAGRMNEAMTRVASEVGLTLPHLEALLCLRGGEGISQQELSDRLLVTKGNTCITLQKLEAAHLVERRSDPVDQRCHRLFLTDAARRLLAKVMPSHDALLARSASALAPAEQRTLLELLGRVQDTLDDDPVA